MKRIPKKKSQKSNPNLDPESPISEFSEVEGMVSPYAKHLQKTFTIDDIIDMWCRGATNGATLWIYCQEHGYALPSSFEDGLSGIMEDIRESKDKQETLHTLINNNMFLLGLLHEKININNEDVK